MADRVLRRVRLAVAGVALLGLVGCAGSGSDSDSLRPDDGPVTTDPDQIAPELTSTTELRFAPDGNAYLAIGGDPPDEFFGLLGLDAGSGFELAQLDGHAATASWVASSGRLIVSVLDSSDIADITTSLVELDSRGRTTGSIELEQDLFMDFGIDASLDAAVALVGGRIGELGSEIFEVDLRDGSLRQLTDTPDRTEFSPVYLDRDHALYVTFDPDDALGRSQVVLHNLSTGSTQVLTPEEITPSDLAISPDRQLVAFVAGAPGDLTNPAVWVMRADGSGLTRVVSPTGFGALAFTPDGTRIIFPSGPETLSDVLVPPLDE